MRALRISVALLLGVGLYYFAVVYVGGILAALAVPKSYFVLFGRANQELGLALLSILGWAAPVAILVAGGFVSAHRLLPALLKPAWEHALSGMVASFAYWSLASVGYFSATPPLTSLSQALHIAFSFPWWGAPNFLAPWVGFALAAWFTLRASRHQPPRGA